MQRAAVTILWISQLWIPQLAPVLQLPKVDRQPIPKKKTTANHRCIQPIRAPLSTIHTDTMRSKPTVADYQSDAYLKLNLDQVEEIQQNSAREDKENAPKPVKRPTTPTTPDTEHEPDNHDPPASDEDSYTETMESSIVSEQFAKIPELPLGLLPEPEVTTLTVRSQASRRSSRRSRSRQRRVQHSRRSLSPRRDRVRREMCVSRRRPSPLVPRRLSTRRQSPHRGRKFTTRNGRKLPPQHRQFRRENNRMKRQPERSPRRRSPHQRHLSQNRYRSGRK